jgi:peptidoglycan/LPS O-acetylase OafA/YrhL
MEVVFFAIASLIMLVALRPWKSLRNISYYSKRERRGLALTALPVMAMAGLQGVYFIIVAQGPGLIGFRAALLACFAAVIIASAVLLMTSVRRYGHGLPNSISMDRDLT